MKLHQWLDKISKSVDDLGRKMTTLAQQLSRVEDIVEFLALELGVDPEDVTKTASSNGSSEETSEIRPRGIKELLGGRKWRYVSVEELAAAIVADERKPAPAVTRWTDPRRPDRDFAVLLGADDSKTIQYLCRPVEKSDPTKWSLSTTRNDRIFRSRFIPVNDMTVKVPDVWVEAYQTLVDAVKKLWEQQQ